MTTLVLLTLLSVPACAQYPNGQYPSGGYPGGGGAAYWAVTYECSGQNTATPAPSEGSPWPWPGDPSQGEDAITGCPAVNNNDVWFCAQPGYGTVDPFQATSSGSVTPVLTWTPGFPGDTTPPPDQVYFLIRSQAIAGSYDPNGFVNGGTGTAADGLGDPLTGGTGVYGCYGTSEGNHLVQVANPSHNAVVRLPAVGLSATVAMPSTATSAPYKIEAICYLKAQQDPNARAVTISCPAVDNGTWSQPDGTAITASRYKDPPLTGQVIYNVRQSDGTLRGDTVKPAGGAAAQGHNGITGCDYTANVGGTWGANATYLWNSSLTSANRQGTFTLPGNPPPDFDVVYPSYLFSYGSSASAATDHIYLHLTDVNGDGVNATANYYMHFHDKYEPASWPEDAGSPYGSPYKVQVGPDPDAATFAAAGYPMPTYPWEAERSSANQSQLAPPIIGPASSNSGYTWGSEKTIGISYGAALGVTADDVSGQFSISGDSSWSTSDGTNLSIPRDLAAGMMTWGVWRFDVKRHKGHLDCYGTNGYTGTGIWYRDEIITIDHQFYSPYQPAGTTNPYDPPAGWKPPGY